jgi:hypothetical protein
MNDTFQQCFDALAIDALVKPQTQKGLNGEMRKRIIMLMHLSRDTM